MFRNYLLSAIRNLIRHKKFSLINIIGLGLSMAVCMLIIEIVLDQLSYDDFHKNKNRIYRVISTNELSNDFFGNFATTAFPMSNYLKDNYPMVEEATVIRRYFGGFTKYKEKNILLSGLMASPEFFKIFDFELIGADPENVLNEPNTMVLKEEVARKYFGEEDPIGKTMSVDGYGDFKVQAIIKEKNQQSHMLFEALASIASLKDDESENWTNIYQSYAYILLKEGYEPEDLNEAFKSIRENQYVNDPEHDFSFHLQPLTEICIGRLLGNEIGLFLPRMVIYFLSVLALLVIVTAAFNYTNLSLAKSLTRAKEIGVRKVTGAYRSQIFTQFLVESVLAAIFALVVAYILLQLLAPAFTGMKLISEFKLSLEENIHVYAWFLVFAVTTGLVAGFIPALYLSSFNPVTIFKDISEVKIFSRIFLRKVLTVGQFTVSIILVITIILLYRQVRFFLNADYGFNKENILNVQLQGNARDVFETVLEKTPEVKSYSWSSHVPGVSNMWTDDLWVENKEDKVEVAYFSVNRNYMDIHGIKLLCGNNFTENSNAERESYILINEEAVNVFQFGSPVEALGKTLFVNDSTRVEVIGVIPDYHYFSMFAKIGPMALRYKPQNFSYANLLINSSDIKKTMDGLDTEWKKIDAVHPLEARFLDEEIHAFYSMFNDILYMVGVTSFLAILIASMGLFAMVTYAVETRMKEIGIRKAMGATNFEVIFTISKSFIVLIITSLIIALPLAYFGNQAWLGSLPYAVSFGFGTLLLGSIIIILLSILTIGSQTSRAASVQPADSLRYE